MANQPDRYVGNIFVAIAMLQHICNVIKVMLHLLVFATMLPITWANAVSATMYYY